MNTIEPVEFARNFHDHLMSVTGTERSSYCVGLDGQCVVQPE
jgi:hypothetical protein